jgi:hypothetical protein
MPILRNSDSAIDLGSDRVVDETSDERFDRSAFARRAIDLVQPRRTTIAICEGAARLRVESGRIWGRPRADTDDPAAVDRWALIAIPPRASRRAIALAVAELARAPRAYALDVLMGEAAAPDEAAALPPCSEPSAA